MTTNLFLLAASVSFLRIFGSKRPEVERVAERQAETYVHHYFSWAPLTAPYCRCRPLGSAAYMSVASLKNMHFRAHL